MRTGPICRLCGSVVPTVSWATLVLDETEDEGPEGEGPDHDLAPSGGAPPAEGGGPTPPAARGTGADTGPARGRGLEVGLCPDCMARAKAEGRLLAKVVPIGSGRGGRRRRAAD